MVLLTLNIDISDRLINGELCSVFDTEHSRGTKTKIYLNLDDSQVELKAKSCDRFTIKNNVMRIEPTVVEIHLSKISNLYVKRAQISLVLAWDCTFQKVQGLSL